MNDSDMNDNSSGSYWADVIIALVSQLLAFVATTFVWVVVIGIFVLPVASCLFADRNASTVSSDPYAPCNCHPESILCQCPSPR